LYFGVYCILFLFVFFFYHLVMNKKVGGVSVRKPM